MIVPRENLLGGVYDWSNHITSLGSRSRFPGIAFFHLLRLCEQAHRSCNQSHLGLFMVRDATKGFSNGEDSIIKPGRKAFGSKQKSTWFEARTSGSDRGKGSRPILLL
ncbi:hypothetical protein ACS0TY_031558 [Phlomoides rotata]